MRKRIICAVVSAAILILSGCSAAEAPAVTTTAEPSAEQTRFVADWNEAIEFIRGELVATPGISENTSEAEINTMCAALADEIKGGLRDEVTIYYRLREIVAKLCCCHASIYSPENYVKLQKGYFPFKFTITDAGWTISGATEEYKELIGAAITGINGITTEEILKKLKTVSMAETDAGLLTSLDNGPALSTLRYIGVVGERDEATLSLSMHDGSEKEQAFAFIKVDGEGVEGVETAKLPLGMRLLAENDNANFIRYDDPENGIMLFKYSACADMEKETVAAFFDTLMEKLNEGGDSYKALVIDVRGNGGGNRNLLRVKLEQYQEQLRDKQICFITDHYTASAAVQVLDDGLRLFGDKVKIYGTPTCGAIHNYTEVKVLKVPKVGMELRLPMYLDDIPWLIEKYGNVTASATPDVYVIEKRADFLAGIDTPYLRIVDDLKNA